MNSLDARLAGDTLDLVNIPSVSGREQDAADWVEERLSRARPGLLTRHGNALAAAFGGDPRTDSGKEWTALVGHLDTVPENGHPAPRIEDGVVHGLGSTDMKGALAVMLKLAEGAEALLPPERGLVVVFYDCEEVAWDRNGLRPFIQLEPWMKSLDLAVLMEPTGNRLELGCVGTLHAEVTVHGEAAHSARPWTGDNAVHKAANFLTQLSQLKPRELQDGPALYKEVVNVTTARAGVGRNVIPDKFVMNVNLRFPSDRSEDEAVAYLRTLAPEGATVEITDLAPAAPACMDSPSLKDLAGLVPGEPRAKQAWTDVAQFALLKVPAVNFGPGIPELAHKVNESVPVSNLVDSCRMLERFLSR